MPPETRYRLDDQRQRLGDPPWSGPALEAWEGAHGHDCRLPCYPEHGCLVIEAERERLAAEVERLRREVALWRIDPEDYLHSSRWSEDCRRGVADWHGFCDDPDCPCPCHEMASRGGQP